MKTRRIAFFLWILIACRGFGTILDGAYDSTIRVEQLAAAYRENSIAAEAKYAGARIILTGKVHSVGRDHDGDPFIMLGPFNSGGGTARCKFHEIFNAKIASLKPGLGINVRGTVVDGRTLKDCSL